MKYKVFYLAGLLVIASCQSPTPPQSAKSPSTRTQLNLVLKSQESIAKEIVSIEYAIGDALLRFSNANAISFAAEINSLSDRLDKISKELDAVGPFPAALRERTLNKLADVEKTLSGRLQLKIESESPPSEFGEIIASAIARSLSARISVKDKAGLLIEVERVSPDTNESGPATNKP